MLSLERGALWRRALAMLMHHRDTSLFGFRDNLFAVCERTAWQYLAVRRIPACYHRCRATH